MKIKVSISFLILFCFKVSSQEERTLIKGQIFNDSIVIENVHIINKTTRKATVSDSDGVFHIYVKENDELLFSSIQFKNKVIIINSFEINKLKLIIQLEKEINSLDEITIKKSQDIAKNLGLPNAGKKPLNKLDSKLNYHSKASIARVFLGILLNETGSINDIYYITSAKRKKDRKLKELRARDIYEKNQALKVEKIRKHLRDSFFKQTLKIRAENIDDFIVFCLSNKAFANTVNGIKLETIEFMVQQSNIYLTKLQHEK